MLGKGGTGLFQRSMNVRALAKNQNATAGNSEGVIIESGGFA
jgi:hypothetical protein